PTEVRAFDANLVGVAHAVSCTVHIEGIRLTVEHLNSSGITKRFIHAQSCAEADVVRYAPAEIEPQTICEQVWRVGLVSRQKRGRHQQTEQLLLHLRREAAHRLFQLGKSEIV